MITKVQKFLPKCSKATLLAKDGALVRDVTTQLGALPHDATQSMLHSGNDALQHLDLLRETCTSVAAANYSCTDQA